MRLTDLVLPGFMLVAAEAAKARILDDDDTICKELLQMTPSEPRCTHQLRRSVCARRAGHRGRHAQPVGALMTVYWSSSTPPEHP